MTNIYKYSRLVIACLLAFGISNIIFTQQYITPLQFNAVRLKNDVQKIFGAISTIHFEMPKFGLISQKIEVTPEPTLPAQNEPTMPYEDVPTGIPSSTPSHLPTPTKFPSTSTQLTPYPTNKVPSTTRPAPTSIPPTNPPKPTKGPDMFPVEASLQRPGRTVDEMFAIAAEKACIPASVLRAIASIESGGFFNTVGTKYLILYNSYNWWNSSFIPESEEGRIRTCSGWAYDQNTGLIPADSKNAGKRCKDGYNSGLAVMGVMSTSPREFELYKNATAKVLGVPVSQVDRRVILDALILTGFAIQKEVKAGSCSKWSAAEAVKGACSYYGSCGFQDGTYYCNTFCRNLKTYGGGDCSGAIAAYKNSCWK
jgi:hypothetical protein